MKVLIRIEFEKLIHQKWAWFILVSCIPFAYALITYFVWVDQRHLPDSPFYVAASMSASRGMKESIYLFGNLMVALLAGLLYTEEFQGGKLRMFFLRSYSRGQIFVSKWMIMNLFILLMMVILGVSFTIFGVMKLPSPPEVMISGNRISSTNVAILFYTLKQYALDFATLIGGGGLFIWIAMYCRTAARTIGIAMIYIIISIFATSIFDPGSPLITENAFLLALIYAGLIPGMQVVGVERALSGDEYAQISIAVGLVIYFFVCIVAARRKFTRADYLN
ncbi:hypothetical protein A9P44_04315 [Paenibacillus polymyxa]|uniref:ABC transporter permease n=1 Tax=Paenibacillus jamilae TaxID=114136 RepID=UPI0007ABC885|nr:MULTISPECIES: ABC transporter permease [Paenibacillus]KZE66616.1 hypothetical protein AV545_03030 [Paenibacillus jamilae]OBA06144.1 hypothetical protein A9P44_04315 [Paenibacillus polymyxa]